MSGRYQVVPITGRAARAWIAENHRHLPKLNGALFAVGVALDGQLVGVATAGNPARPWQGSGRLVVSRCAVLPGLPMVHDRQGIAHASPACTMLYRALARAARALGYRELWTYSLAEESGQSMRAAGFVEAGITRGGEHDTPARRRRPADQPGPKRRWVIKL